MDFPIYPHLPAHDQQAGIIIARTYVPARVQLQSVDLTTFVMRAV
jgi:hypothetical protein